MPGDQRARVVGVRPLCQARVVSTSTDLRVTPPTRREWLALAVLSTGLGLIVLDGTIVGVALPVIIADIGLDLTDAQWANVLTKNCPGPELRRFRRAVMAGSVFAPLAAS